MPTPNTTDPIAKQSDAAMHRIKKQINQSAGQHIRAVRRVRAGGPPPTIPVTPTKWSASQAQANAAAPAQTHSAHPHAEDEPADGWSLLGWALVALAATACAVIVAFAIGFHA